jgi:hypothetical protein
MLYCLAACCICFFAGAAAPQGSFRQLPINYAPETRFTVSAAAAAAAASPHYQPKGTLQCCSCIFGTRPELDDSNARQ